jgi:superfamily II DNA helicase RecQ
MFVFCATTLQKLAGARIPYIVLTGANSDAINKGTVERVLNGEYRAVYFTPEIIFSGSKSVLLQNLWRNERWRKLLVAVVIDEVHCVEKWSKFRADYTRLGDLRVWAHGVPFVGLTATLTADAILQTKAKLFLSQAEIIRVNEVRTNVRLEVHTQPKDAMKGLHNFLRNEKTIVYFETIAVLVRVYKFLQWIRPDLRGRLGLYYSTLDDRHRRTTMKKFVDGDILILLATEAAGMGVDIQDVVQVIQYG